MERRVYGKTAQTRRQQQGLPVTDRAGRAIGRLIGREYHKLVSRPDQILRSPPGFGFDIWAMDFYVLPRVDAIVVEDRVNGRVLRSSAENFKQHRIEINRGAGPQYVLPLVYWQTDDQPASSGRTRATSRPVAQEPPSDPPPGRGQPRLL